MKQNMLGASLKTCHWGYFDATLPPAMTISSGDEVVINTVSGGPQNLPDAGFQMGSKIDDHICNSRAPVRYLCLFV